MNRNSVASLLAGTALCLAAACSQPAADSFRAKAEAAPASAPVSDPVAADVIYIDEALRPVPGTAPHPFTRAIASALEDEADPGRSHLLRANLERATMLPGDGRKHIVVDTASATLWLLEGNRIEGRMRVIAGKPGATTQTPMMAGYIRFGVIDPYWNVPPDLVAVRIAPAVLREGTDYLQRNRMEALSDWSPNAELLDPARIDWPAIANGTAKLRVRQLPGEGNMLGRIKFMMPNRQGIYLHDTPDKASFGRADRLQSAGCIRVEDPVGLWRWITGERGLPAGTQPDRRVDLIEPVPVYITYLTVTPDAKARPVPDRYGRDAALA